MQDPLTDQQIRDAENQRLQAWQDSPVKGGEDGGYLGARLALPSLIYRYVNAVRLRRIGLSILVVLMVFVTLQKWSPVNHQFATTSQVGEVRPIKAVELDHAPD